jgi:hypothetical protein
MASVYIDLVMTEKEIARRTLDRADNALGTALLRPDIRGTTDSEAWNALYYSRTAKNVIAFRRAHPDKAALIEPELDAVVAAEEDYKAARLAAKADLEAKRAARIAKAAEKAVNPARPLASVNPLAAANYDKLSDVFSYTRSGYIAHCLEVAYRAAGGKVCPNVNETNVAEAAGADFDGYLARLAGKIAEPIEGGRLAGSIWDNTLLTVQTRDSIQVWRTRCIVNVSCLGNLFNQWPTRRLS